ncbi:MAG: enterotoxin [Proteobacteria bacterium]|nr:enterotoxin [Pseudomonadota bacterium]
MRTTTLLTFALLATLTTTAWASTPWLPTAPGAAHCSVRADGGELTNAAIRFAVTTANKHLQPAALGNGFDGTTQALDGELFALRLRGGKSALKASAFAIETAPRCEDIAARPGASRAAEAAAGAQLTANLVDPASGLRVLWTAQLRDGADYVRETFRFLAPKDLDVSTISLIDLQLPGAVVDGTATGSPIATADAFFGFEHPMAEATAIAGHASMLLRRALPLRANVPADYSAVLGVAPRGQLRRGFMAYLENERAHPFRTFLHYNSWYDIGYFTPYSQADALRVIAVYGKQLVQMRGVKMDSFLFDDGWDDTAHLWQFNHGFPDGFKPLAQAAAQIGAAPGVWLSPWGGYGPPREARLQTAKAAGYEVDDQGLALSGPRYYRLFHDVTMKLLREDGINQFKLDGTGSPDKVTPGSAFDSDFAAAIALIDDLRAVKPDLFINLTTGTWPSPFWLRTADSIWRGGEDHSFAGTGSDRQRWITYRDADTYGGIVRQGPLFPLNSLMLHGIIYARHARGLDSDPHGDFADEVHSYFASGTGLQEMYISPDLLTAHDWDILATAAKWARERADVLRDSHWIGGDPARGEAYGWASWSPQRAVLALRNPSARAQRFQLDLAGALELPEGAARAWQASTPFATDAPRRMSADVPLQIELKPYQVLVWDLQALAH